MALINFRCSEIGENRLQGSFSTDGNAMFTTNATIAGAVLPTANSIFTVVDTTGFLAGDLVAVTGIGPGVTEVVAGISAIPLATQVNLIGTRVSQAIAAQPMTVLPVLNIRHAAKRIVLTNLTNGNTAEWDELMGYGAAIKKTAAGAQSFTATQGFYNRGGALYFHPSLHVINSNYTFTVDY